MAQQGLFTQGPSIDDLLAKRNTRASTLQRQLMQQASQGAARPMETQAASLIGSSLGRALAGAMDGGSTREKLEAKQAEQNQAQGQFLEAAKGGSQEMFDQVASLQKTYPQAALKMLALAKEAKKEEEQEAALTAKATAEAAEATRIQKLAADKVTADTKREDEKAAALVAAASLKALQKLTAEDAAALLAKKTVLTGAALGDKYGAEFPKGSIWEETGSGDLTWLNKPTKGNVNIAIPEGMRADFGEDGQITKLIPIEGSKQWIAQKAALAAEAASMEQESKTGSDKKANTGVVNDAVNNALTIAEMHGGTTQIFGPVGALNSKIDATMRSNLEAYMEPIEANTAFGTLAAMRAASKTGGALGAISEKELALLKAAQGALTRSQSKEQFVTNLKKFQKTYNDVINGDADHIARFNKSKGSVSAATSSPAASATYTFDPASGNMVLVQQEINYDKS